LLGAACKYFSNTIIIMCQIDRKKNVSGCAAASPLTLKGYKVVKAETVSPGEEKITFL